MSVRTYDFKKYQLIVGNVPIQGYVDGTGINVETNEDDFTLVSGADGLASRSKSNNNTARLTITLKNTSASNSYLSFLRNSDKANNSGIRNVILKDFNGDTLITSPAAWVAKPATVELSKEITDREWIIDMTEVIYNVGGNPAQVG